MRFRLVKTWAFFVIPVKAGICPLSTDRIPDQARLACASAKQVGDDPKTK